MRWHIKRTKLLFALIPIISIAFFILTADNNIFADQSFAAFDIYMKICDTARPVAGKDSPRDYTAAENFAIAAQVFNDTDSVQGTVTGTVSALGGFYTQKVLNYHAKTGSYLFNESVSLSAIASVAEQRFFKNNAILYRKGNTSGSTVTGWDESVTELASAVYRQRYGIVPHEITKYSVTSGNENVPGSIKSGKLVSENPDGTFTYELELDAEEAQKYSRYEMMTFAGVTEYPKFISCRIAFTIDSDWRVTEIKSNDVYEIAIMNGIRCESNLTDTFTYEEGYMPERAQIFIDYVPTGNTGDIGAQKGPSDYLSEAFGDYISGAKKLSLTAKATIAGETLDITAAIDIKNNVFDFLIGDKIFAEYKNDELFVAAGSGKYRISISDLSPVLDMLGVDLGGVKLDASILESLFANHSIVESDTHVHVIMPFELMGIKFDVDMGLLKSEGGKTQADTIDATITIGDTAVGANVQITDSVNMPAYDEKDFVSLKPLLDAIFAAVDAPAYSLGGKLDIEAFEKKIPLEFTARILKEEKGIAAEGNLTVADTDIAFAYKDGAIYLGALGLNFKADTEDFGELIGTVTEFLAAAGIEITLPEISPAEIISELLGGELSLDTILDLLTRINYDGKTLTAQIGGATLTIEHGEFPSRIAISGLSILGIGLNADITTAIGDTAPIEIDESKYIDVTAVTDLLPSLAPFVKPVINTAEKDSFKISFGGTITEQVNEQTTKTPLCESIRGSVTINLKPALTVAGSVRVSGANIEFAYTQNTLYVTVGAFDIKLKIDDAQGLLASVNNIFGSLDSFVTTLSPLIGEAKSDAVISVLSSVDSLMKSFTSGGDILSKLGFLLPSFDREGIESLLGGVSVQGDTLSLTVSPADGGEYNISLTKGEEFVESAAVTGLSLFGYTLDMSASLECGGSHAVNINDSAYTDIAELKPILDALPALLTSNKFELSISEGKLNTSIISGEISGKVQLSFAPFEAVAALKFGKHEVNVLYKNDTVYARINGIKLKFAISDISSLIAEINSILKPDSGVATVLTETLETVSIIQNALGGKTLADILSYVTFFGKTENGITATVDAGDFSLTLVLSAIDDKIILDITDIGYKSDIFDSRALVSLSAVSAIDPFEYNLGEFADLSKIQSYIRPVIDTLGEKYFDLSFGGTVVSDKNALTSIEGNLKIMRTQAFADVYANIVLGGSIGDHDVKLYVFDNTDYSPETNPAGTLDKGKITAYVDYNGFLATIDFASVMRILGAACDILDLDIPMLDELTKDYYGEELDASVFETMDIVGLDSLRGTLESLLGTAEDVTDTADKGGLSGLLGLISDKMIDDMLLGISLSFDERGFLSLGIENSIFNALNKSTAQVTVGHDGTRLTDVSISNLIVNGNTVRFDAHLSCDEFDRFAVPTPANGNKLYDFSSIDELLVSLIKTASLKQFEITGNIKLNVLNIVKPTVPFNAKVKILDDGSTVAAIKLEVPFVSAVVGVALTRSDSYIYYANNMLYFVADVWSSWAWSEGSYKQTEMKSATVEEFLANPFDYLFFLLRLGDIVKDPIMNAISGGSSGTSSTDINDILKEYSYNAASGDFTLDIGLKEATGNKDLNDLTLTLGTTDGYISSLGVNTSFTSMNISLSLENTKLSNLAVADGKVTGANALSDVSFGRSSQAANLGGDIDSLEDKLAVLFPVEAAETFAQKANSKADKANSAAKAAKESSKAVQDGIKAEGEALAELNAAKEKLALIATDSFGYDRAKSAAEYAQKVYDRAVTATAQARADRIAAAQKAAKAAEEAYLYARKAANIAGTVSALTGERAMNATASAALAAVSAVESAAHSVDAALTAAAAADDGGANALAKAQTVYESIMSTITDTATQAAKAANKACSDAINAAASSVAKAQSYAESGEWLDASNYAARTLDAISAMDSANKAAQKASLMSGDDNLLETALSNAETVKEQTEEAALKTMQTANKAANALSKKAVVLAESANTHAAAFDKSADDEVSQSMQYAEAAIAAANTAIDSTRLFDSKSVAAEAEAAKKTAQDSARTASDKVLDASKTMTEKYAAAISAESTDRTALENMSANLSAVVGHVKLTYTAKKYASTGYESKLVEIYSSAASAATHTLTVTNKNMYSLADNAGKTLENAINKIGRSSYSSGTIYRKTREMTSDAEKVSEASNTFDYNLTALIENIASSSANIYDSAIPVLQNTDNIKAVLYDTNKGTNTLKSANTRLVNAGEKASDLAKHIMDCANSHEQPGWDLADSQGIGKAQKTAATAYADANKVQLAAVKSSTAIDMLDALYNTFFAN